MRSHALVTATDIEVWANYRVAQEDLPRLIRRLVHATATGVRRAGLRAGEGVQLPGWDGNVLVDQGSSFVPSGASAWELGSGQDPDEKANEDYRKRSENPLGLAPPIAPLCSSAQGGGVAGITGRGPAKRRADGALSGRLTLIASKSGSTWRLPYIPGSRSWQASSRKTLWILIASGPTGRKRHVR